MSESSLHDLQKDHEQYLATNTGQINLNVEASLCAQSLNHRAELQLPTIKFILSLTVSATALF